MLVFSCGYDNIAERMGYGKTSSFPMVLEVGNSKTEILENSVSRVDFA